MEDFNDPAWHQSFAAHLRAGERAYRASIRLNPPIVTPPKWTKAKADMAHFWRKAEMTAGEFHRAMTGGEDA